MKKILVPLDMTGQRVVNAGDPQSAADLATKQYVDAFVRGLTWKDAVDAASTTNIANLASPGASMDGVTLTDGRRYLLKDQSTASQNGIYVYAAAGTTLSRAPDMPNGSDARGVTVSVRGGTVNDDRTYNVTSDPAIVGTDGISWSLLGGGGTSYTAGDGLSESPAGTFNVVPGFGLENVSDAIRIAASAAGAGLIGGAGSALAVDPGTGIVTTGDKVGIDTAVVARKFAQDIGNGSATTITVTHNFTRDCQVEVYRNSTPWDTIECDVERPSATTVDLKFAVAPASAEYRVIVIG